MVNTTGERLAKLETNMENIGSKVDQVDLKVSNSDARMGVRFELLERKLDEKFDQLDKKYASKWVEKWIWVVVTGLTTALISFSVIKPAIPFK